MKKLLKSLAYVALAGFVLTGCTEKDTPSGEEDPVRGSTECRIESFVLNLGDQTTITGDVYDYDKSIDISYTTDQIEMMKAATATIAISKGASISPDPAQAADYTQPVSFTVTAEDGKTVRTYTTRPVEKVVVLHTKVEPALSKTTTEMGLGSETTSASEYKFIGVSGDKLVIGTKVFDYKTFAAVGELNMDGYTDQKMTGMGNDHAGNLIAAVTPDGNASTPTTIICWRNGWDQAPSEYIKSETSYIGKLISAGGNIFEGQAVVSAQGGSGPAGAHFVFERLDGIANGYHAVETKHPSNDGNWTQMISPCSSDPLGTWFMFESVSGGTEIYTWTGWSAPNSIAMTQIPGVVDGIASGPAGWGNFTLGAVRGFTYNNTAYGALITTGWGATYVSIVDTNGEFLLNPNDATITTSHTGSEAIMQITYAYDEAENTGYVFVLEAGVFVKSWKLTVAAE